MERPPILMGEAPSRSGDRYHMFPLSGAVAQTLCTLAGIPPEAEGSRYGRWTWALYDHFECMNLIERYPGAQGRGAAFPFQLARSKAVMILPEIEDRVVVLLGVRLKQVFTIAVENHIWHDMVVVSDDYGVIRSVRCQVVAIPHPSGLNRVLNDPVERERAGDTLREAMERARAAEVAG